MALGYARKRCQVGWATLYTQTGQEQGAHYHKAECMLTGGMYSQQQRWDSHGRSRTPTVLIQDGFWTVHKPYLPPFVDLDRVEAIELGQQRVLLGPHVATVRGEHPQQDLQDPQENKEESSELPEKNQIQNSIPEEME